MILKLTVKGLYDVVMADDTNDTKYDVAKDAEARIMILEHIKITNDHLVPR